MWIMEINNVPDKVFDKAKEPISKADREVLRVRSSYLAAIGDGRELMFVLGILPPTVLSNTAYLWMHILSGVEFTITQLREIRKIFLPLIKLFPYQMLAEVQGKQSTRFVQFLGGTFLRQEDDRMIYGWNT